MNPSALNVGVLVDQLGGGGAQRSAIIVASQLYDMGIPTRVLSARTGSYISDLPQTLPVHLLAPRWPSPLGIVEFTVKLCKEARRNSITAIFANGFTVGRLALLILATRPTGVSRRTRVVVVEHSTLSSVLVDRFPNRLTRWVVLRLTRWLYRRADALVGVSKGVSNDLQQTLGLAVGSVTTIYNPVDAKRIVNATGGTVAESLVRAFDALPRPVTITTGRLVAPKAQCDLMSAFVGLPHDRRGSLVILGEGPLREDLERQAEQLGISDQVWMPGFVVNPWWFIARADVFALSSRLEGHPLVLLEALACGVPVVSTDCPSGPREILDGIPTATTTPVGNISALRDAISYLHHRPRLNWDAAAALAPYAPLAVAEQYLKVLNVDVGNLSRLEGK